MKGMLRERNNSKGDASVSCPILDISGGGVRLECHRAFKQAATVHLDAFFDDGDSEPFAVDCVVSWIKDSEDGHSIGVQFGELTNSNSSRLDRYLQRLQSAEESD